MHGITDIFNLFAQEASKSGKFITSTNVRRDGTPDLILIVKRNLKVADYVKSITRLQTTLRDIPIQYTGAEDLYGRNTSIVHITDPRKLADLHISESEGLRVRRRSKKVSFDEAVTIIEKWGAPEGPSE